MTPLDLEILKTILVTLTAAISIGFALPASLKALKEFFHIKRAQRREESNFALALAEKLNDPNIKRYGEELGYAALIGDSHLNHDQRKFLLSFTDAAQIVETYMQTRHLLSVSSAKQSLVWKKPRWEIKSYRLFLRIGWFFIYVMTSISAFSPWLTWIVFQSNTPMSGPIIVALNGTLVICLSIAIYFLSIGVRIGVAEKLLERVRRSTSLTLMNNPGQNLVQREGQSSEGQFRGSESN